MSSGRGTPYTAGRTIENPGSVRTIPHFAMSKANYLLARGASWNKSIPRSSWRRRVAPARSTQCPETSTTRRDLSDATGATVFSIAIAGLGIGASTTVFGLCQALLLRPLPYRRDVRRGWIRPSRSSRVRSLSFRAQRGVSGVRAECSGGMARIPRRRRFARSLGMTTFAQRNGHRVYFTVPRGD
jgi:hypothetical protein